jgi:hypothetical protein
MRPALNEGNARGSPLAGVSRFLGAAFAIDPPGLAAEPPQPFSGLSAVLPTATAEPRLPLVELPPARV